MPSVDQKLNILKPYNSILGEQFLCKWTVEPHEDRVNGTAMQHDAYQTCMVKAVAEQISHHPPVSAFYYMCDEKGITACGLDHICARFTGTCEELLLATG